MFTIKLPPVLVTCHCICIFLGLLFVFHLVHEISSVFNFQLNYKCHGKSTSISELSRTFLYSFILLFLLFFCILCYTGFVAWNKRYVTELQARTVQTDGVSTMPNAAS